MLRSTRVDDTYKERQLQVVQKYGKCNLENYNATNTENCITKEVNSTNNLDENINNNINKGKIFLL